MCLTGNCGSRYNMLIQCITRDERETSSSDACVCSKYPIPWWLLFYAFVPKNPLFGRNCSVFYRHSALIKQKLFRSWKYFVLQNQIISMGNVSVDGSSWSLCKSLPTSRYEAAVHFWCRSFDLPYPTALWFTLNCIPFGWNPVGRSAPEWHLMCRRH